MDNLYLSSGDTVIDIDTTVQKEERLCFCLFVHFLLKKKQRVATSTFLEEGGKEGRKEGAEGEDEITFTIIIIVTVWYCDSI